MVLSALDQTDTLSSSVLVTLSYRIVSYDFVSYSRYFMLKRYNISYHIIIFNNKKAQLSLTNPRDAKSYDTIRYESVTRTEELSVSV